MPKTQLSITGQIALTLAIVLFLSIAFTLAGFMASRQERDKIAAFASDGAVATGTITAKRIHIVPVSKVSVCWLDLTFKSDDGATRNGSMVVANSIYDRYAVGSAVPVTYVKSRPEWFYVPGEAPTERSVGISVAMFKYGGIMSLLCVVGLLVLLFRHLGGGTPTGQSPTRQQLDRATGYRGSNQSRSNFGLKGRAGM
jgi:hypothetical protein